MSINSILVIVAIVLLAIALYIFIRNVNAKEDTDDTDENEENNVYSIEFLVDETARAVSNTLRRNLSEKNLTRDEIEKQQKRISDLRDALNKASNGNPKAKYVIKTYIEGLITKEFDINTEEAIDKIIPFDNPSQMKGYEMFETLLYVYNKHCKDLKGEDGFAMLMNEYELQKPVKGKDGEDQYIISKQKIAEIYKRTFFEGKSEVLGPVSLTLQDKKEILVQRIFEKYDGFGVIDMLIESSVDEIMCGVSGVAAGTFRLRTGMSSMPMSYESIWIVYHGIPIYMKCLTFETQEEFIRVSDNVYKYEAPHVLSKSEPGVQSTMEDGSRIVVARDPMGSSRGFWLRKFDSAPSVAPHKLLQNNDYDYLAICLLKWAIKCELNMIISGGMGTGKTTMLKSLVRYIDNMYPIRVYEKQFELNLNFTYPEKNIFAFQEAGNMTEQDCLNFGKKTMGAVSIIGEIANKEQASYFIQSAYVASRFGLGTHHAETAESLIESISDNLLQAGIYSDKKDAVRAVVSVINLDCHLSNIKGNRHIERISEIVPLEEIPYPSETAETDSLQEKVMLDASRFMKDMTNKKFYKVVDLLIWKADDDIGEKGHYEFINPPSDGLMKKMVKKLMVKDEEKFKSELENMRIANEMNKGVLFENINKSNEITREGLEDWISSYCY